MIGMSVCGVLPAAILVLPALSSVTAMDMRDRGILHSQLVAQNRRSPTCPADFEPLVGLLLRDLPSYANRLSQRLLATVPTIRNSSYVLITGQPDFTPLTLGPGQFEPTALDSETNLRQVFFTSLERQYILGKKVDLQQYHWLFLAQTSAGWRLSLLFSRTGNYPGGQPPTPPRDNSNGVMAEAIRLWLRDCYTGRIKPLTPVR